MAQTSLRAKAAAARNHGARALLVVMDPSHRTDDAPYGLFRVDPDAEDHGIPVLRIKRSQVSRLIDELGLDALAKRIDGDLMPRSRALPGVTLDYEEHLAKNRRTVRNVVGVLPGRDARGREAVVIGAHYDHVGLGGPLSLAPEKTGEVHNGADDNASGTAAVIEMARAAVAERSRFSRTLVFVAFASEERGLLGSAQYVRDPAIPVADTMAMLNLDMVGRAKGSVDVSGAAASSAMGAELEAASKASGDALRIKHEGPGAGRSDDASFLDKNIPAVNFFTGFHDDYHRPSDDWQKIDAPGTARVAALALELAARLANRDERLAPAR
jgi:Zn-dependent M28 family amino/carboxypeptidase